MKIKTLLLATILTVLNTQTVKAHQVNNDPNHAHVCTESSNLNVRSTPYVDKYNRPVGKIKHTLKKGSKVNVIGSYSNWRMSTVWYHISTSKGQGFISGKYTCF